MSGDGGIDFTQELNKALVERNVAPEQEERRDKLALIAAKKQRLELMEGLPFLYGWKWYPWARAFYDSQNKIALLCAANQISKSSTQIRKMLNWATNEPLQGALWKQRPNQFWYLYPTRDQVKIEFETKWPKFLPRGFYKESKTLKDGRPNPFQWRAEYGQKRDLFAIHFDVMDLHCYFKTYAQDTAALQTGTCDAIFCDEELPMDHYEELMFRISASDGYFNMVFTATLGQEFWRKAMQPGPFEQEELPQAHKQVVSLYDAMRYTDGSLSHWTPEKIQMVKNRCSSHREVLRRVYGHFIRENKGMIYQAFDVTKNVKPSPGPVPDDWVVYAGVDVGSGGKENHPGAIAFVAVDPTMTRGRVFLGWRGDGLVTTASDIFSKYQELRTEHKVQPREKYYDYASRDFFTIASRAGDPFLPADKSHEVGMTILNTLFKNGMLTIDEDPELQKLVGELISLRKDTPKTKAKDDFADALRYACSRIPWDWSCIPGGEAEIQKPKEDPGEAQLTPEQRSLIQQLRERREAFLDQPREAGNEVEAEMAEWNELYG